MPRRPVLFAVCPQDAQALLTLVRMALLRLDPASAQTTRLRSLEARLGLLLAPEP